MRVGPDLQPITNESMSAATANTADGARLDIADFGADVLRNLLLTFGVYNGRL